MFKRAKDQDQRDEALDINRSFIVQAPAGSGKTELLTLRYMKLLANVDEPEAVLAITFTRKAAAEMRARVIESIQKAKKLIREHGEESLSRDDASHPVDNEQVRRNFRIAHKVIKQDREKQWNLERNPGRLRIQTIDSFNIYLANQLPIASRIGGDLSVTTETKPIFNAAIRSTLSLLDSEGPDSAHLSALYAHLDNNPDAIEKLLGNMITKRDQWLDYLPYLFDQEDASPETMMRHIDELAEELLEPLFEAMLEFDEALIEINNYAHTHWPEGTSGRPAHLEELPPADADGLAHWTILCNLLLTNTGGFRKTVTAAQGFPPKSALKGDELALGEEKKALYKWLIGELAALPLEIFESLLSVRSLPTRDTLKQQWPLLRALAHTLRLLNRQLILKFTRLGVIDHTQAANAAFSALRTLHNPTDFALALDSTLSHILIDEFQDTSERQLVLLEELIEGWSPNDGKTLFLVGDAMQSCYNFRNANVGVYLKVRSAGIGHLKPETLELTMNFRSQASLITSINEVFSRAFPKQENIARGAVCYSHSQAGREDEQGSPLRADWISYTESGQKAQAAKLEAELLVERIHELRKDNSACSIAVLARTRNHFRAVIAELRQQGVDWIATDIDRLGSLTVIDDLLALLRALSNTADDIAWLALLRAPWCGLDSVDLLAVRQSDANLALWQAIGVIASRAHTETPDLSLDGHARLCGLHSALSRIMELRRQCSISALVLAAWELLQGPNLLKSADEEAATKFFFNQLHLAEEHFVVPDIEAFATRIQESFTSVQAEQRNEQAPEPVQLMTIHKSKGLQFDHVLIPQLGGKGNADDKDLIVLHERINREGAAKLLIAPVPAKGSESDAATAAHEKLYSYIRNEKALKSEFEETRLVYIAMTRARYSVGLFSTLLHKPTDSGEATQLQPIKQSLLARVWEPLGAAGITASVHQLKPAPQGAAEDVTAHSSQATPIRRLSTPLVLSQAQQASLESQLQVAALEETPSENEKSAEESQESERLRRLRQTQGTLCHEFLEAFSRHPLVAEKTLDALQPRWLKQLKRLGASVEEAHASCHKARQQLLTALSGDFAWIFDPQAEGAASELPLARNDKQEDEEFHSHFAVDRTLLYKGNRWIIDYKTAHQPEELTEDEFIALQTSEHKKQLRLYASLMSQAGMPASKLGLYLLDINRLVEIPF